MANSLRPKAKINLNKGVYSAIESPQYHIRVCLDFEVQLITIQRAQRCPDIEGNVQTQQSQGSSYANGHDDGVYGELDVSFNLS